MIYNECCLKTMSRYNDNYFDMIITSPPYNMNLRIRNGKYCSRQIVKELSTKYANFSDNLPIDEFYELHKTILTEMLRVSSIIFYNFSIVTGSKRAFFNLIGDFSENIKEFIVWDKGHGQPAMQEGVLNRRTEFIVVLENDKSQAMSRKFNHNNFQRGTLEDLFLIKRGKKVNKSHGATFPEELVDKIITNFAKPNSKIYDPFMGTGTTVLVAKKHNMRYYGSEIDYDYYNFTKERLYNLK